MLRHCSTTTATGPMLPCREDVAMMLKQEERQRDKQSTIQLYEFHFTSIQRTSSVTYFAVKKTTQHKLPQLKLGPTIHTIGPPVARFGMDKTCVYKDRDINCDLTTVKALLSPWGAYIILDFRRGAY